MRNLDETFARFSTHALGGGIGCDQVRMLSFQGLELAHQSVVVGVAYLGLIQDVVQMFVAAQGIALSFDFPRIELAHCLRGAHLL